MKRFQTTVVIIAVAMTTLLNVNAEIITGKDGSRYDVLSVAKTNAMGIVVNTTVNARGQNKAWIPYNNMTPADQQRFGFDQVKYDDYLRKMAEGDKTLADNPNAIPNYRTPKPIGTVTQYVIPQTTTREQYLQQLQDNQVQENQANAQNNNGNTSAVATGATSQTARSAGMSTQTAMASIPGSGVAISPSGIGINTPIVNLGVSPYGVVVNTPVTNVGVTTNCIAVQTPIGGIALTPGPVPEPMYYPATPAVGVINNVQIVPASRSIIPAQIPLIGVPVVPAGAVIPPVVIYSPAITAIDCPQPTYPVSVDSYVAGPVYANPVIYTGTVQQPVINYAGAFNPWMQSYGYDTYGYSANYGWSGNPYYYNGSCYSGYRGWGGNVWGGYRGGSYNGGGWGWYCR